MVPAGVLLVLLQAAGCTGEAGRLYAEGVRAAATLDDLAAVRLFEAAAEDGCARARVTAIYLGAVVTARSAYREGGSEESLRPVRRAQAELDALASGGEGLAAIAQLLVMAAAAAAQSERPEMDLLLAQAQRLERARLEGGLSAMPGMSAHELAGDLWLQVHRFETARLAYRQALELVGPTPRALLGLARTAVRLDDIPAACDGYGRLLRQSAPGGDSADVLEARDFLTRRCR